MQQLPEKSEALELMAAYTTRYARNLLFLLIGLEILLVVVYLAIHAFDRTSLLEILRNLFDLDEEVSLPTWFSSVQLFTVGCILLIVAWHNQQRQHLPSHFLAAAGLGFIYLSADEAAAIHERTTAVAVELGAKWLLFKGDHGAWVAIYLVLGLVLLLLSAHYFRNMWRHYRHVTLMLVTGATVFLAGAVGLEVISYQFLRGGDVGALYKLEVALEEFLEMSGISVILYSVLLLTVDLTMQPSREQYNEYTLEFRRQG